MAKKSAKKSSKKTAKKASKKPAKKAGKKASKKASAKALAPKPVKTGKGHTPGELGAVVVAHVNKMGNDAELWKNHFHPGFVSIEGQGLAWKGRKAVQKKCEEWIAAHQVHACKASGPFVGATGFGVLYDMDVEVKATGQRMKMQEVGVYTVKNGKVVQEEFMYGGM